MASNRLRDKSLNFEPQRKNRLELLSDSSIDSDLKPLNIGDVNSGIELSKEQIAFKKQLEALDSKLKNINSDGILTISNDIGGLKLTQINDEEDATVMTLGTTGIFRLKSSDSQIYEASGDMTFLLSDATKDVFFTSGSANRFIMDFDNSSWKFYNPNLAVYFDITVGASTQTLANTGDLLVDCAGDVELNADGGHITFKDDTTTALSIDIPDATISLPADTKLIFGDTGEYIYGDGGKLNIAVGDGDVMSFYDEEIRTFKTLKMQERADAESDTAGYGQFWVCLLYTSPSPRDGLLSRMPSSA